MWTRGGEHTRPEGPKATKAQRTDSDPAFIQILKDLFESYTDVNYHTEAQDLGIAIDWIEDGDKKGAKDYIKSFHEDIKKEMADQGLK